MNFSFDESGGKRAHKHGEWNSNFLFCTSATTLHFFPPLHPYSIIIYLLLAPPVRDPRSITQAFTQGAQNTPNVTSEMLLPFPK